MKVMAIDYGDVRTGVAVSDLSGLISGHSVTLTAKSRAALVAQIEALYQQEQPGQVVVGLPLNMDGSEGPRAEKTRSFGAVLSQALGCEIIYWDERGTSITAAQRLSDAGKKRQKQRARIDAVAAGIILQSYLDYKNRQR